MPKYFLISKGFQKIGKVHFPNDEYYSLRGACKLKILERPLRMRERWTTAAVLPRQNHAVEELTSGLRVGQNLSLIPLVALHLTQGMRLFFIIRNLKF